MSGERIVDLTNRVSLLIEEKLKQYKEIWRTLYVVDDALIKRYCDNIYDQIEDLFSNFDQCIEEKKIKIVGRLEQLLAEFNQIQVELSVEIKQPYNDSDPLSTIINNLEQELEQYRQIRAERVQRLESLRTEEKRLCEQLGAPMFRISAEVPSEKQLVELEAHFNQLQSLKVERWSAVMTACSRIEDLLEKLEATPSPGFENALLERNATMKLDESTMRRVNELVDRLHTKVAEETKFLEFQQERLSKLWERIGEPVDLRERFMSSLTGVGKSAQNKIAEEITRCELIKKENLRPIIGRVRDEIAAVWDKLTYTDEQRQYFAAYATDVFSDDVLDLHELELNRLKEFYETNRDLYELAQKRKTLCDRMEHLIKMASHPDRLKNRGGTLLREEKERKSLEKSLPKIEAELKVKLIAYYDKYDAPFLWHGANLLQKIFDDFKDKTATVCTPRTRVNFSRQQTALSNSLADSIASYSQFQSVPCSQEAFVSSQENRTPQSVVKRPYTPQPASATKRMCTPQTRSTSRLPLRQASLSKRAHSSPNLLTNSHKKKSPARPPVSRRLQLAKSTLKF
ncbi:protein Hypothetical protein cytokinesis [Nesidiocoris tenuis]|uniref:Protein regulator of cytokinesis 1 n=1 Tax=Nesidiocoris tenuis TaxID=355587 RepID=A0ABN7BFE4_9HEMI|nr:protein Hypothetical protein cytokinesis [Nesidiocoris tenuis]